MCLTSPLISFLTRLIITIPSSYFWLQQYVVFLNVNSYSVVKFNNFYLLHYYCKFTFSYYAIIFTVERNLKINTKRKHKKITITRVINTVNTLTCQIQQANIYFLSNKIHFSFDLYWFSILKWIVYRRLKYGGLYMILSSVLILFVFQSFSKIKFRSHSKNGFIRTQSVCQCGDVLLSSI